MHSPAHIATVSRPPYHAIDQYSAPANDAKAMVFGEVDRVLQRWYCYRREYPQARGSSEKNHPRSHSIVVHWGERSWQANLAPLMNLHQSRIGSPVAAATHCFGVSKKMILLPKIAERPPRHPDHSIARFVRRQDSAEPMTFEAAAVDVASAESRNEDGVVTTMERPMGQPRHDVGVGAKFLPHSLHLLLPRVRRHFHLRGAAVFRASACPCVS